MDFNISQFLLLLLSLLKVVICGNQVLVISFDGFRYDYYGSVPTPNFDVIAKTGVHAPNGVHSVFTTKTFPAHWSIVTGLYEESHGIIDNHMYDSVFNETFRMGGTAKWWIGEPIWVTAKKQGKSVGVYFWPGSDQPRLDGIEPDHYFKYNESVPFEERINVAARWLTEEKLDLVMVYFHEPDSSGHKFGASSDEVKKSVIKLDKLLGTLISKLNSTKQLESTNILVVSDHGMTNMTLPAINLNEYIEIEELKSIESSAVVARIEPKDEDLTSVYEKLKGAKRNISVFLKEEIPERYHYKNNRRIKPILVVADDGHVIHKKPKTVWGKGNHGYDNDLLSMRPIFFARGPNFKSWFNVSTFEVVDYYPLICRLLQLNAAPNNGSIANVQSLLKSSANSKHSLTIGFLVISFTIPKVLQIFEF